MGVQWGIMRGAIYCSTGQFRTGACLALRSAWLVCVVCADDCHLASPFSDLSSRVPTSDRAIRDDAIEDSLWLVFSSMIVWRLGGDIMASLSVASQSSRKAASGKTQ